ncbi:acyl-CoA dehydrogenase family protein [Acrocarpospora catenulata]|uniref:acyl-CoA dehydrogenase family protein n=1 Tax=Acrocarpospora catenulata TaxID=2836182 RepID=UPI001BDAD2EB|nr:acyl-CoA dehydrogenase family protein [Acrocarpospora catenulata]
MRRTIFGTDHDDFRDMVRSFVATSVAPRVDEFVQAGAIAREVWLRAGELGLLGLHVPERYGGSDAPDYRFMAVVLEELSRVTVALGSAYSIHADIVAPYLLHLTTQEQRERWLPGFCSGEILTAIGMTEPSGGSDLAALRTRAVRDGDGWRLNGSKTFITNGTTADLVVIAARTNPAERSRGITLFGVEAATPGFTRGRKLDKVGQSEADTAELYLQDAWVPDGNVIGAVDSGFQSMMAWLPQERLSAAVANVAHAAQLLEETIAYVKNRRAFGQSVGSFQHNKFLIADLVTRVEATQAFVDQAIMAHVHGELTAVAAAKVKWWSAQVQNEVLDHCLQLHGGYGFMNEYRVGRAWRDARVTKIWAGSNEIMKEIIGRDLGL